MTPRARLPWIVYARTAGLKRRSYYAGFLLTDGKTYSRRALRYPVKHPREGQHITNEADARTEAQRLHAEGLATSDAEAIGPFLESFWGRDGTYARDMAHKGQQLSAMYALNMARTVRKHVRPYLKRHGKDVLAVDRVLPELIWENMSAASQTGVSGRTVNQVRQAWSVPLTRYWRGKKRPEMNPCPFVDRFDETPKARTIFTLAEARAFLALRFGDPRMSTVHRQMAFTGMRLGECIGMYHGDLRPESVKVGRSTVTENWIDLRHNWQELEGVKGPKKGSTGQVPVPAELAQMLYALERANPWGGPFFYWGHSEGRPMSKRDVERSYNWACSQIGITAAERKRRGLGPHAWRHFFDSYIHIDRETLQKLMRHRTPEMTAHYNHLTDEQRRGAYGAAAGLLGMVSTPRKSTASRARRER